MSGEVPEEHTETVVKGELPEAQEDFAGLADEILSVKEEPIDFCGTEQYFIKPTSEFQQNEYKGETDVTYVMKVEQKGCDSDDDFIDIQTPKVEADDTNKKPAVHCKEEDIDIKYENLETESTDWRCSNEMSKTPDRAENDDHKFSLTPESQSKVDSYKCKKCSFATKYAGSLKRHILMHKAKSEIDLYKCQECSYAGKQARHLKQHMLVHKDKSEVDLHKCKSCSFTAKRLSYLKTHTLIHEDKSEVDLHKCKKCSFATKYAGYLKTHMLVHKDKSEFDLYKCHECSYVAKQGAHLKQHMLVHKDKSEVDLYKCKKCSLTTKYAASLRRHTLVHKAK